jgi:uncharacterized protein
MANNENFVKMIARDGKCKVQASNDNMQAYLVIDPPFGEGKWPTLDDAKEALRADSICYGVIDEAVEEVVVNRRIKPVLVAKGKPPVDGVDSEINYLFETGVFRKAFIEDRLGRVDYRQVQTVQDVVVGQVIAQKIPATPGEVGFDVRGQETPGVPGKDKQIKLGKNVAWSEDNLKIYSTINGEPVLVSGRLSVHPLHELKGDVNFDTGNISFAGNLVIRGNVQSGFKVETDGDITIYGNVDTAEIRAGGNLFIQGGVSGMDKAEINCSGDLSAKYIEHATVNCEGSVTVKEAIMHCQINADSKVLVEGGKGLIVGGLVRAGEEISAKLIGSKLGTITELEVGVQPKTKLELQELESEIKQNKDNLEKTEKATAILSKVPNLPPDRKKMFESLVMTSYALKSQIAGAESRRQEIVEEILTRANERGRIKVKETIYPGVRVTIGKTTIMIRDEIKYTVLVYREGEIQIQSYP